MAWTNSTVAGERLPRLLVLLLAAGALGIRLHGLASESLWMDELRQTSYYLHPFTQILYDAASQTQPPLDYWIGRVMVLLTGSFHEFVLRLPAAVFGTGLVVMSALLITRISSWPIGLFFGALAALIPFNIYYAQEARPYAIAVFFFLCVLWALNRVMTEKGRVMGSLLLLFGCTFAFLCSRALFPLTTVVSLSIILVCRWGIGVFRKETGDATWPGGRSLFACLALAGAVLLYIPIFNIVLSGGAKYIHGAGRDFDIMPLVRAFEAQTEPLTLPLLLLLGLSYVGLWRSHHLEDPPFLWSFGAVLLPVTALVNLWVFHHKTNFPFRPAYAGYLLPLTLMLAAAAVQIIWQHTAESRYGKGIRGTLAVLGAVCLILTGLAAVDHRSLNRKPDWRGVSAYLGGAFGPDTLLVFDAMSPYGQWEPTFYGFPRYYRGTSKLIPLYRIPMEAAQLADLPLSPVLVLFHWKSYYLTSRSRVPILSVPSPQMKTITYDTLAGDPLLDVTVFTGFSIVRLKDSSGDLIHDLNRLNSALLAHIPRGSWLVENHLAAAALKRTLDRPGWMTHLEEARMLAPEERRSRVQEIAKTIDLIHGEPKNPGVFE